MRKESNYINKFSVNRKESSSIRNAFKKAKTLDSYDYIKMLQDKLESLKATYKPKRDENRNLYLEKDINELAEKIKLEKIKYEAEILKKRKHKKLDLFDDLDDKSISRTLDLLDD